MSKYIIAVIIAIMAISGCSKDTKEQDKQKLAVNEAQTCVDKRIADYRKDVGEDVPIRQDMLNEWSEECGIKESDSESASIEDSDTKTTVAAVTTTTAPQVNNNKPKFKVDIRVMETSFSGLPVYIKYVVFTATDDNVSIGDVIVNRGNCSKLWIASGSRMDYSIKGDYKGPVNLKFGQKLEYQIGDGCPEILEVQLKQNGVPFTVTFNR